MSFSNVMDEFFNKSFPEAFNTDINFNSPSTNIKETDNGYSIEMAIPGVDKDKIDIRLEKDQLVIESTQSSETVEDNEDTNYHMRQFNYSSFRKSFYINNKIDPTKIDAEYKDGILYINLEKRDEAKIKEPRNIEIK
jgi:HSP20 family protein